MSVPGDRPNTPPPTGNDMALVVYVVPPLDDSSECPATWTKALAWLPTLGPTATWAGMELLRAAVRAPDRRAVIDPRVAARSLGVSLNKLSEAIERLNRFGLATWVDGSLFIQGQWPRPEHPTARRPR